MTCLTNGWHGASVICHIVRWCGTILELTESEARLDALARWFMRKKGCSSNSRHLATPVPVRRYGAMSYVTSFGHIFQTCDIDINLWHCAWHTRGLLQDCSLFTFHSQERQIVATPESEVVRPPCLFCALGWNWKKQFTTAGSRNVYSRLLRVRAWLATKDTTLRSVPGPRPMSYYICLDIFGFSEPQLVD